MITKHFPFNRGEAPGETFLDSEISVLSEEFENVYVFAVDSQSKKPSIKLPENVHPYAIGVSRTRGMLKSMLAPSAALRKEHEGKTLKERLFADYFDGRAHTIAKRIAKEMKGVRGDTVIYSYWLYYHAEAAVLLKSGLEGDVVCFSRAHGYDLYENRKGYLPFRKYLIENLDMVFPCSNNGREYLVKRYGHEDKIKTSYLGTKDCGSGTSSDSTTKVIVSCSRIAPVKRMDKIAHVISLLETDVLWVHFGGGEGLEQLERSTNGIFVGNVPNERVLEYYKETSVDLFINLSESEGLPISIMEALSFGIPVVATDVGGTGEVVQSGKTGLLVNKDCDDKEIAGKIDIVLSSSEYSSLRENCRKVWEEKFAFRKNTKEMLNIVRGKLGKEESLN